MVNRQGFYNKHNNINRSMRFTKNINKLTREQIDSLAFGLSSKRRNYNNKKQIKTIQDYYEKFNRKKG